MPDLHKGGFGMGDPEIEMKNYKFEMADPIWPSKLTSAASKLVKRVSGVAEFQSYF